MCLLPMRFENFTSSVILKIMLSSNLWFAVSYTADISAKTVSALVAIFNVVIRFRNCPVIISREPILLIADQYAS